MTAFEKLYINGTWVAPGSTETIDVVDSVTEEVMASVPSATAADVDAAVVAAKAAFEAWATTPAEERAKYMTRIGEALGARMDEIATAITKETGMAKWLSQLVQVGLPINSFNQAAALADSYPFEQTEGNSLIVREPVGVVGCITPWNYPLHQIVAKLAPALAAGATVVLKPSEVAPLVVTHLIDAIEQIGLPAGVVNVVHGTGPVAGEALVRHPEVDMVSFTGSVAGGSRVGALAAADVKRVALELGGKSANVLLEDADLPTAVKVGVANAFLNGGQTCSAWTRMIVPAGRLDEALALAADAAGRYAPGDPLDPATTMGPMVSAAQARRVQGYVEAGLREGAGLVCGGPDRPEGLPVGHFLRPTVLGPVDPGAVVAQDEVFGPVLSIIPYAAEADALAIANGTAYGLHGAVWSADEDRAVAFARRMRTGGVDVNGAAYNPVAPFGGYGKSGVGRELGPYGLEEYLEVKSIQL